MKSVSPCLWVAVVTVRSRKCLQPIVLNVTFTFTVHFGPGQLQRWQASLQPVGAGESNRPA